MFAALLKNRNASNAVEDFEKGIRSWDELSAREQGLVYQHYQPKVRYLAQKQKSRVPAHMDFDDLKSAGNEGLLDALQRFRPEMGYTFSTYAETRINGAMFDEMRAHDPLSRGTRTIVRVITAAADTFEHKKGRRPSDVELARLTRLSVEDVRMGLQAIEQQHTTDMDMLAETLSNEARESGGAPERMTSRNELVANVRGLLRQLSERDNFILSMSFMEEYTLREIAEALGVTEGRVCQLRTQALKRLRELYVANYGRQT